MKLEYLYNKNRNIKQILKKLLTILLGGLLVATIIICTENKFDKIDEFGIVFIAVLTIVMTFVIMGIFLIICCKIYNYYKRKQYLNIINNGKCYKGNIIMAYYHSDYLFNWLLSDSGNLIVQCSQKEYIIKDIDYDKNFKILEQITKEIKNNDYINIDVYILNNKVVGDLNSIKSVK